MGCIGAQCYGGGGVVEEGWREDECSGCIVCAGGDEGGSILGPNNCQLLPSRKRENKYHWALLK